MGKVAKRVLIGVGALVVVFCAASFVIDRMLLAQTYARVPAAERTVLLTDADIAADYAMEDASFEMDGKTLRGHIYKPQGEARGFVVFRHGITSQHQDYLALITALADRGYRVFAYDAIGCGESDGDDVLGMTQSALDVQAALRFVEDEGLAEGLPVCLMGHSWGGFGVAAALASEPGRNVAACASLSGFDSTMGILTEAAVKGFGPFGYTQVPFLWLNSALAFGGDVGLSAADGIDSSGIPVLVVHGTGDETISYDGASVIAQRDRITNPRVEYFSPSEEGRDGHNSYFYSPESQQYLAQKQAELEDLIQKNGGELDDADYQAFRAGVDLRRANTADPALIDAIDAVFSKA